MRQRARNNQRRSSFWRHLESVDCEWPYKKVQKPKGSKDDLRERLSKSDKGSNYFIHCRLTLMWKRWAKWNFYGKRSIGNLWIKRHLKCRGKLISIALPFFIAPHSKRCATNQGWLRAPRWWISLFLESFQFSNRVVKWLRVKFYSLSLPRRPCLRFTILLVFIVQQLITIPNPNASQIVWLCRMR